MTTIDALVQIIGAWLDEEVKVKRIAVVVVAGFAFMVSLAAIALLTPPSCAVNNSTTYCIEAGPEGADLVIKE